MQVGSGVLSLAAGIAVLVVIAVVAVLYFGFGAFRRRKGRKSHVRSATLSDSRIEILESTTVDAERRLLLVRCDQIEHLIMVGGPSGDVVVENDVKKVRGPASAAASKSPVPDAAQRTASAFGDTRSRGAPAPASAPTRDHPAPAERRPMSAPAPSTTGERGAGAASDSRLTGPARQRPGEPQPPRRDSRASQRPAIQPTPLGATRPERQTPAPASRRNGHQPDGAPGLPSAGVPWTEPDSIENEIVRALRVDPVPRGGASTPAPRQPAEARKGAADPSTTLGDLADKLEEALAQEVQAAAIQESRTASVDEFAFDADSGAASRQPSPPPEQQRNRTPRREPAAPRHDAMAPSPEPERRQPQSTGERREEAPVISLNSRRRETADPLEDEMARLLGELTGDTKGR